MFSSYPLGIRVPPKTIQKHAEVNRSYSTAHRCGSISERYVNMPCTGLGTPSWVVPLNFRPPPTLNRTSCYRKWMDFLFILLIFSVSGGGGCIFIQCQIRKLTIPPYQQHSYNHYCSYNMSELTKVPARTILHKP